MRSSWYRYHINMIKLFHIISLNALVFVANHFLMKKVCFPLYLSYLFFNCDKSVCKYGVQYNVRLFATVLNSRLKGQCYEIFDLWFFHQSTPPRALTHRLKPFHIWLHIRRDNHFKSRENRFQRCQWYRWNWKWSLEFPNFFLLEVLI
jgi:hypothetical protein